MGALIDTSVWIDAERKRIDLDEYVSTSEEPLYLSVITVSELYHGLHRAVDTRIRRRRSAFVNAVIEGFRILPVDLAVASTHSQLWADLSMRGKMIGMNDLWIAATCVTHELRVITGNEREFSRIAGLEVEVWRK